MTLRNTFIFLTILISPYLILVRYGDHMEMYPAVIYPSGAGFCYKDSTSFTFNYSTLHGKTYKNEWKEINSNDFLYPIGSNYIYHFISRLNWIGNPPEEKVYDGFIEKRMQNKNIIRPKYRESQLDGFKSWISNRLNKNGFKQETIKIEFHQVTYPNNNLKNFIDSTIQTNIISLK